MDFAKSILSKYGWKDGDGLGKEKQGITKPIKANLKFDNAGLGATATSGEFGNNWWERCFNDAAQNVQVQKAENGKVFVDLKDAERTVEVSTKSYSLKKLKSSGDGVYGNNFLAADVSVANFEMTKYKVLTDEELFEACGGRTAHKGARHGLKLSGKLARLAKQEKEMLAKLQNNKTVNINSENQIATETIVLENKSSTKEIKQEKVQKNLKKPKVIDENKKEMNSAAEVEEPELKQRKHKKRTKEAKDFSPEPEGCKPEPQKKKKRKYAEELE